MTHSRERKGDWVPRRTVVHVLTSLDFGGVERRIEIMAGAAIDSEWNHIICALGSDGEVGRRLTENGVSVHCLGQPTRVPSVAALFALYRLLVRLHPAAIHTHGAEGNFHGLIAARLSGVPVRVAEEIGMPHHSPKAKYVFRQVYRFADRVIGVSDAVRERLIESREVSAAKALRIYNPVHLSEEAPDTLAEEGRLRVGFVGRLEAVKNLPALIEAVATVSEQGVPVELWIVGDGNERGRIEKHIEHFDLGEQVRMWGYQRHPLQYVKQCDIYCQPSLSEGFSNALVEAMSARVPVIATTVGGSPEIVEDRVTGWLVDGTTPQELALALSDAWNRRSELAGMGEKARASVTNKFEPSVYVERLEELYESIWQEKNAS